jgi:hypothetical protein
MALSQRQTNLFAAEDWKVAYKAFNNIDFTSYDFDTLRLAMVNYIRTNFPENFNDYIESSEFIAIIELLAFLAQSLAFRMDLNSRENFLETAERRDSVFKLARMLGYNPRRNTPASGLMKITSIATNEPLTDSLGTSLANKQVFWNDVNNPESYEQFITILNSTFSNTNRFTSPIKSGTVGGIPTDLYRITKQISANQTFPFTLNVNGINRTFEITDGDYTNGKYFYERHPDPLNNLGMYYRNDGKGMTSPNSGFFMLFKQGQMQFTDFNFDTPIPNRVADLTSQNINETDVYLQEISTSGAVISKWVKIPNTVGQTLNYNSQAFGTRNLFATENLDNDAVRLKFPDGNFGNSPKGIYRAWYRTSDATSYTLQPDDARSVSIVVPYQNKSGTAYTLTVTLGLQIPVNNSLPTETLASIKQNAPQTYYTQNRMISAQDYNIFPFAKSGNIQKLSAVNRTHAGHSRYIDINDPTGTLQNIDLFADDGFIYKMAKTTSMNTVISGNNTANNFVENILPTYLKNQNLNNYVYDSFRDIWKSYKTNSFDIESLGVKWNPLPVKLTGTTGYFTETSSAGAAGTEKVLTNTFTSFKQFQENNYLKFVDPNDVSKFKWVRITKESNAGLLSSGLSTSIGPWTLSATIPTGWRVHEVIVTLRKKLQGSELTDVQTQIEAKKTFGIGFAPTNVTGSLLADTWYIINNANLDKTSKFNVTNAGSTMNSPDDASWILLFEYEAIDTNSYRYKITIRGEQYVFNSKDDIKFYNVKNIKVLDSNNKANTDKISITTFNNQPGSSETFRWYLSGSGSTGNRWYSEETGTITDPTQYSLELPLRSRDTNWFDVEIDWVSNFGILRADGIAKANVISNDLFVNDATVTLNTYFDDGVSPEVSANMTIANNMGRISRIPGSIDVNFTNTTFGYNIFDSTGNITYKAYNPSTSQIEIYHGNTMVIPSNANSRIYSYGISGTTVPLAHGGAGTNYEGNIQLSSANTTAKTGTIIYGNLEDNNYLYASDVTAVTSTDKIKVRYENYKQRLVENIDWHIVDVFREADGYTDPSKVIVAPYDTDNDLVPDKPLQFKDFVGVEDLVFLENYKDYDGYTYQKPSSGGILDLREEAIFTIVGSGSTATISPGSYTNHISFSTLSWLVVDTYALLTTYLNNVAGYGAGVKVYVASTNQVYLMTPSSTNSLHVNGVLTTEYAVYNGRGVTQNTLLPEVTPMIFKWEHVANKDVRIDPSISNVVEMLVLTKTYYSDIQKYMNVPGTVFPLPPTSDELTTEFRELDEFKSASDTIIYRSAKFKKLFGADADLELQAKFRIVKLNDSVSDNELKSKVILAFKEYFNANNWDFGETFYFTELTSYVHTKLAGLLGSIVILPRNSAGKFGDLFSVKAETDELFLNTATVSDIEVIDKITRTTLSSETTSSVYTTNNASAGTGPYAINGYYPLYSNETNSNNAGNGTSHTHVFYGTTFYMPNGLVMGSTMFHGTYTGNASTTSNTTGSSY